MHVARGQHVECAFLCQFWWKGDSQSGRHKGIKAAAKLLRETTRQLSMQNWKTRSRRRRWRWRSRARWELRGTLSNCCSTGSAIVGLDFCSIKTLLLLYSSVNDGLPDRLPDWWTDWQTDWLTDWGSDTTTSQRVGTQSLSCVLWKPILAGRNVL